MYSEKDAYLITHSVGFFVLVSQRDPCLPFPYEPVDFHHARTQIVKWVIQYAWCLELHY